MLKFAALLALMTSSVQAFSPEVEQIVRFQPSLRKGSKAFVVKGSVSHAKAKMETSLEWLGPGQHRFVIREVPPSFYGTGEGGTTWTILRSGRKCVLKTDTLAVSCPPHGVWAALELSGQPDETAALLLEQGFISEEHSLYKETDARQAQKDSKDKGVRVALGANGSAIEAVLELLGPSTKTNDAGEPYPTIQFDQSFLTPLLARLTMDGELVTLRALTDLTIAKNHARYQPLLSSRLEISVNKQPRTVFNRSEPIYNSKNVALVTLPKTITDISALYDRLSVDGQNFLRAVLLTH